jgi:NADPH2:quinone reductase
MKSMVIKQFGDSNVFEEMTLPIPAVTSGHVLIKVKATSVNPLDYKMRKGLFPDLVKSFPITLHGDVSGIIEKVGEGVKDFSIGDEVYGCVGGLLEMGGGLAEYVLADIKLISRKPKSITFSQAAALPLVALTAWEGLVTCANVQKNNTVLIHGGTGGVGHIAIQLAKWLMELTKQLGADIAINYKDSNARSYVPQHTSGIGFDVVFDTVGGENLKESIEAAALFGQVISILAVGNYDLTPAFFKGLSIHTVMQPLPLITGVRREEYGKILAKIAELVDSNIIRPLIAEQQFTVNQVGAAHDYLESGKAVGKVVLEHA